MGLLLYYFMPGTIEITLAARCSISEQVVTDVIRYTRDLQFKDGSYTHQKVPLYALKQIMTNKN